MPKEPKNPGLAVPDIQEAVEEILKVYPTKVARKRQNHLVE